MSFPTYTSDDFQQVDDYYLYLAMQALYNAYTGSTPNANSLYTLGLGLLQEGCNVADNPINANGSDARTGNGGVIATIDYGNEIGFLQSLCFETSGVGGTSGTCKVTVNDSDGTTLEGVLLTFFANNKTVIPNNKVFPAPIAFKRGIEIQITDVDGGGFSTRYWSANANYNIGYL